MLAISVRLHLVIGGNVLYIRLTESMHLKCLGFGAVYVPDYSLVS